MPRENKTGTVFRTSSSAARKLRIVSIDSETVFSLIMNADENIVSSSSPVQVDNQGDNRSRSSSSSSSSSSGSSSSGTVILTLSMFECVKSLLLYILRILVFFGLICVHSYRF